MNNEVQEIIKLMREMRLPMMAEQMQVLIENNELATLSAIDLLKQLIEVEYHSRKTNTINRLKKNAKLSQRTASIIDIEYHPERNINKSVIEQLMTNQYILKHRNIIILGACGTGKSFVANALGNHACESFYTTFYCRIFEFIDECNQERIGTGSINKTIRRYAKYDVLIIDDFLIHELHDKEVNHLFQLIEYRHGIKSTIVCSQLEPKEWHAQLGGNILADSILDRIIPNAYEIVIDGKSMRTL